MGGAGAGTAGDVVGVFFNFKIFPEEPTRGWAHKIKFKNHQRQGKPFPLCTITADPPTVPNQTMAADIPESIKIPSVAFEIPIERKVSTSEPLERVPAL